MSEQRERYDSEHAPDAAKSSALEQALRENERLKAWARVWKAKAKANRGWAKHEQWNREANAASAYWHMKRGDTYRKRAIALMHQSGQLRYLLCLSEAIAEFRVRDIDALRAQVEAMKAHPREFLGRTVRYAWVAYCKETGRTDKPSHLASWEEISEWDREVDRQIGEAVRRELLAAALKELDDA